MNEQQKVLNSPFEIYVSSACDTIDEKQLDMLRKFRDEGIYIGPTYNKYVKSKELLNVVYGASPYPIVEAMRGVSDDIIQFIKEEIKERTLNLPKTSMEIKHYGYLDTDMCYNIYEMFSESKKLSLKSVVEWNKECGSADYTKDIKVSFRFPIDGITYNYNVLNVLPQDIQQCTLTKRSKENRDNFRKFIRRKSK